jgi:regulatory protein
VGSTPRLAVLVLCADDVTPGSEETIERALGFACAYLDRRDRTVSEVRSHLERKAVQGALIENCLRTLVEQGLLDDARYAELFASDKRELEQWGSERIRRGLLSRGIDRDLVEAALSAETADRSGDGEPEDTELGRALTVLRRRFPSPPADGRERERALGVLLRKGYESDLAVEAVTMHARGA